MSEVRGRFGIWVIGLQCNAMGSRVELREVSVGKEGEQCVGL